MQNDQLDTIVALATPPGRAGVAIVRVSGKLVKKIAKTILKKALYARYAIFSDFLDQSEKTIDQGLAIFFPGPHSFTGEDILELHAHGGSIVINTLIHRILALGARLAKPGEFSERAFLNNKIDLTQAEAIADLIDASSEQAARAAIRSLQGEFSERINALVEALIRLRTYVEAAIDFSEEEINFLADKQITNDLAQITRMLETIQEYAVQGNLLRDGITAVITGLPNAGKSSLLNKLSGKDVAIVTDIPGTTRDLLREHIVIDGMPIHFIDTAGLRESNDVIEQEGIRRAHGEIERADLVLFVVDASCSTTSHLSDFLKNVPKHAVIMTLRNKIDLINEPPSFKQNNRGIEIALSVKNGAGIELLKNHIKMSVGLQTTNEGIFSARRRHIDALARASTFLKNGLHQLDKHQAGELLAEDLRQAQIALSEITGIFTSDDLLGKIFSSFCIGK
ncbi:MAG: mnmE [Gammaproteobacteria bacterium]|jgi:tRNA modification GTPase|nr:mnmE [Gammaproteobacteria bacterium]